MKLENNLRRYTTQKQIKVFQNEQKRIPARPCKTNLVDERQTIPSEITNDIVNIKQHKPDAKCRPLFHNHLRSMIPSGALATGFIDAFDRVLKPSFTLKQTLKSMFRQFITRF